MINALAASSLEVAINRYLVLALEQFPDEPGPVSLAALDGKLVAIELSGFDVQFYLAFTGSVVRVQSHCQGEPDARITATPVSFLRYGLIDRQRQQQTIFAGDVKISGDVEVGHQVNALFEEINIDWEEHLSRIVGDIAAHEIGLRTRALGGWLHQTFATIIDDTSEYIHEEKRWFIQQEELDQFLLSVDVLRDDVARLGKKIERLQQQVNGVSG